MWGIQVNIGRPGCAPRWKWVNDQATNKPWRGSLDAARQQRQLWITQLEYPSLIYRCWLMAEKLQ